MKLLKSKNFPTIYKFSISFKELALDCTEGFNPQNIIISCLHKKRHYYCKTRKLENSYNTNTHNLVIWPNIASDCIEFITTLYKKSEKQSFYDKEWTLIVEEVVSQGKFRPLAAVALNISLFVEQKLGVKNETKLKLRPLQTGVLSCFLHLYISVVLFDKITEIHNRSPRIEKTNSLKLAENYHNKEIEGVKTNIENEENKSEKNLKNEEDKFIDKDKATIKVMDQPDYSFIHIEKDIIDLKNIHYFDTKNTTPSKETKKHFLEEIETPIVQEESSLLPKKQLQIEKFDQQKLKPNVINEHNRISKIFALSEQEERVMVELEDLKRLRREENKNKLTTTTLITTSTTNVINNDQQRKESLQNEARRLMKEAFRESTIMNKSTFETSSLQTEQTNTKMQRCNSNLSLGSQIDLRTLEVIKPQITFRKFRKHHPSPSLQRKTDERPIIGKFNDFSNIYPNNEDLISPNNIIPQTSSNSQTTTNIETEPLNKKEEDDSKIEANNSQLPITKELDYILKRISEVEKHDAFIENKIRSTEPNSNEEKNLIGEHLKLLNEKDALVRRQDYLNVLSDLNATTDKIAKIQKFLSKNEIINEESEKLMLELKELMDLKNDLSHALMDKEIEDEEETERCRLMMEKPQNFLRGYEEPVSASKRFIKALLRQPITN